MQNNENHVSNVMELNNRNIHKFVLPIKISIDPMERLLVASFKGDPEYTMLEPQVYNDPVNGKGMRVLRYRRDNKVDVYWQPGVHVERSTISIGAGIGDFMETAIEPAKFEITNKGVDVHFSFNDAQGRKVELKIKENTIKNNRFPFLAPVGNDIENPQRLFLVNMLGFEFIKRKGTEVIAKIGNRMLFPESFPVLRDFQRVFFMRYSTQPVIGTLNPKMDEPLVFETNFPGSVEINGMKVLIDKEGKISQLSAGENLCKAEMEFLPGFPDILNMKDGAIESGRWIYRLSGSIITGGIYNLIRKGNSIEMEIDVTENWKPENLPLSFRIFTFLVKSFRKWPTTYKWKGTLVIDDKFSMNGSWERKNKK